mgnify:CR=1 FL=1
MVIFHPSRYRAQSERQGSIVTAFATFHHVHSGTYGAYMCVGRYFARDRRLMLLPRKWVMEPSKSTMLAFDGYVSHDGQFYSGVLPNCFDGPFDLRQG